MEFEAIWENDYLNDCIPNFINNKEIPRHSWYEFKEGFSSSLVERAIDDTKKIFQKDTLKVLDPFSGSGTTALVSLQNHCDSIGIEVNPFMNFVGSTKSCPKLKSKTEYFDQLRKILDGKEIEKESDLEGYSSFSSKEGNDKWLYNSSVLRGFEALKSNIREQEDKDIFMLALFSAMSDCCNARKDGKCLRYKKNWNTLGYTSIELRAEFERKAMVMIEDLDRVPLIEGNRKFLNGDAKIELDSIDKKSIDLIVFSPPYLNSFDYSDIYRPELFLGNYVTNNNELKLLRGNTLRSHVQFNWHSNDKPDSMWARQVSDEIRSNQKFLWNIRIPDMVDNYFSDMEAIFDKLFSVSSSGAHVWFVVATSSYVGVEIPVDLILADIAVKKGWSLVAVNALRKLRTSSQYAKINTSGTKLRESLVICRKD